MNTPNAASFFMSSLLFLLSLPPCLARLTRVVRVLLKPLFLLPLLRWEFFVQSFHFSQRCLLLRRGIATFRYGRRIRCAPTGVDVEVARTLPKNSRSTCCCCRCAGAKSSSARAL